MAAPEVPETVAATNDEVEGQEEGEGETEEDDCPHRAGLKLSVEQIDGLLFKHMGVHCVDSEEVKEGFNNKVYLVSGDNGQGYAIRATKSSWPALKVESEVAGLSYCASKTKIPVPKVFFWNSSDEEVGCRYMVMERVAGKSLSQAWPTLSTEDKRIVIYQLLDVMEEMQRHRFTSLGGLVPQETDGQGPPEFSVGRHFSFNGPFASEAAWLADGLRQAALRCEGEEPLLAPLRKNIPRVRLLADQLADGRRVLPDRPIVLHHGDFCGRNVMVEGNRVTAILDWEWVAAAPVYKDWIEGFHDIEDDPELLQACVDERVKAGRLMGPATIEGYREATVILDVAEAISPWFIGFLTTAQDEVDETLARMQVQLDQCFERLGL